MRRLLILLVALLLALFTAPAFAQDDPDDPFSDDEVEQVDPEDEDEEVIPDDAEDDYVDRCDYTSGEGDYEYCGGCRLGADGDYVDYVDYCVRTPTTTVEEDGGGGEPEIAPVVQTLSATELPLTGGDPGLVALFGSGLVLVGIGGRLRMKRLG